MKHRVTLPAGVSLPTSMSAAAFVELVNGRAPKTSHENNSRPKLSSSESAQQPPALGQGGKGEAPRPGLPIVRFTLYRVRLLDRDGKFASVKNLCDGLQYAGLICGDREDQITLEVQQVRVSHYFDEKTVIEIDSK